jgi:hydrogenase maturation protease
MDDMKARPDFDVVVAGFGSPHGDDRAGWQVVEKLSQTPGLQARLVTIREGTQLVSELEGCRKLIAVDACRSSRPPGTITRFRWPDTRIRQCHNHSTHGIGLCNALDLAGQLDRLPSEVEVYGIEIGGLNSVTELSCEVEQAVEELAGILASELREAVHA